ncbi:MAG: hypothetical protein ACRDOK_12820 [Streptosporangiaceae bacterium]
MARDALGELGLRDVRAAALDDYWRRREARRRRDRTRPLTPRAWWC